MTRVLHLLTASAARGGYDAELPALVSDVIRHEPGEHHTLLLGGEPLRAAANDAELHPTTLLPDTLRSVPGMLLMPQRIGRLLKQCDRVDAWTPRAAQVARMAGAPAVQPRFRPGGLTRLARQVADPGRLDPDRRAALRHNWGLSEHDHAVALIGSGTARGDTCVAALAAVMVHGVLRQRDRGPGRAVLLCHPEQWHRRQAQAMLDQADLTGLLIQEPRLTAPWAVFPGCDAAATTADETPTLFHHWAQQAGLALCTTPTGRARELAQAILEHIDAEHAASADRSGRMMPTA